MKSRDKGRAWHVARLLRCARPGELARAREAINDEKGTTRGFIIVTEFAEKALCAFDAGEYEDEHLAFILTDHILTTRIFV